MTAQSLHKIFELQEKLMTRLGLFLVDTKAASHDAVLGIVEESTEILREERVNLIPWRQAGAVDYSKQFEESVDVLFYLTEYWILIGKNADDVIEQYKTKHALNMSRISEANGKQ